MQRLGPTSHNFHSQRLRLHYADWGNPDAPPLILLHGGRDHARSWDWTAEKLRKNWHVIAPDLRGHGDSEWVSDGNYDMTPFVYDLAQLIHQRDLAPVTIVAHSLGGNIALRYTGLYPDTVRQLVAIEGLGPSPAMQAERDKDGAIGRLKNWIESKRNAAGRQHKRYPTFEDALKRMAEANEHLNEEYVHHLTVHAVSQNEDGSYSWKFDPHVNVWGGVDIAQQDIEALWGAITCPTLLVYGEDSWASNPAKDGRIVHFNDARVESFSGAGHWVHHDRFDDFVTLLDDFLKQD
ncbi:alpha/beta hydrolase [uncultured Parasphingopyxis sp.]|uniref:alpha/beta fold hydrolase n=1 Tax=uncultured Parasphingopyxis sp. TaxID=1547918 RepID=UPI00262DAD14|nr:alpha/beta hydrolase [uncultured Parasphingopyxis sp.]